jgi:hypothetical protein
MFGDDGAFAGELVPLELTLLLAALVLLMLGEL